MAIGAIDKSLALYNKINIIIKTAFLCLNNKSLKGSIYNAKRRLPLISSFFAVSLGSGANIVENTPTIIKAAINLYEISNE